MSNCLIEARFRRHEAELDSHPPKPNVNRIFECGRFVAYKIEGRREIFAEPAIEWMRNPIEG
jgi:hypothetical protein